MRQPLPVVAASCAIAFVWGVTLAAQAAPPPGVESSAPARTTAWSAKPFSRLFAQRVGAPRAGIRSKDVRPDSARWFRCEAIVVSPDTAIDPRFEMRTPDTTTRFTMRTVPPPCR